MIRIRPEQVWIGNVTRIVTTLRSSALLFIHGASVLKSGASLALCGFLTVLVTEMWWTKEFLKSYYRVTYETPLAKKRGVTANLS
jgi:hypothetical protein